ncbi:MAG: hypothetical protein KKG59_01585 [Nanoarchaeota archaeon]|nr:hypothetical protein [Nanoarchaeota archaeon]
MAKIEIVRSLVIEIRKKFDKAEANRIIDLIETLKDNPKKGKPLGTIGGIVIKELKYKQFRFYFVVEGYKLKLFNYEELKNLLIRFVRMSDKKNQQKVIEEIKKILKTIGPAGFE